MRHAPDAGIFLPLFRHLIHMLAGKYLEINLLDAQQAVDELWLSCI
jgi:hypothetical protein